MSDTWVTQINKNVDIPIEKMMEIFEANDEIKETGLIIRYMQIISLL